ncbi:hypothetical protein HDU91_003706 [Kappamyces sp. JEL0680]|nr:hypothetical protein HDU91_003706 [Kappamyces sp. JEL0680]
MVNAYYNPLGNEIVFPAAILQPPFFYPPTADNPFGNPSGSFGAIGAVISHEISHGFDDQGSLFDHDGNMENWWQEDDKQKFKEKVDQISKQFDKYPILGGSHHVNGSLCAGENIADLGGVKVSFAAFEKYIAQHPEAVRTESGYTPQQQFFISFGALWGSLIKREEAIKQVATDPHSPALWRVNGTLVNIPEFHKAFGIKEGEALYTKPEDLVEIW